MTTSLLAQPNLSSLVCRLVEEKLKLSGVLTLVKKVSLVSNPLGLTSENALLFDFQGPTVDLKYRMLISFHSVDVLNPHTCSLITQCRDLLLFDLAVFWTTKTFNSLENQSLKEIGVQTLTVLPPERIGAVFQHISDFIHVPQVPYDQLLKFNLLANKVVKRLQKKFHLVLSELAADSYDDYGTFATKQVMTFEDDLLKDVLIGIPQKGGGIAIDVGCGNGRHTRILAEHFSKVIAFDLSRKMIDSAKEKDYRFRANDEGCIKYYECDIEYEEFPNEHTFTGRVDFVCASFGMPSFIEDTAAMLQRFCKWLRPEGKVLFTFYNSQSLALQVFTPWDERALPVEIDLARHTLEVELTEDVRVPIYCKPIDEGIMEMVKAYFTIEQTLSYPHLLSILPPSVFGTDTSPQSVVRSIIPSIDKVLSEEMLHGHYMFLVASKKAVPQEGYIRVLSTLNQLGFEYEILEHQEVVSTREISEILSLSSTAMVKTVIFKSLETSHYLITLIPPQRQVDISKLATIVGQNNKDIILASPDDVQREFGFPIGGIPPFGFGNIAKVKVFIDPKLRCSSHSYMYMGVGDNTKTLKLSLQGFLRLTTEYEEKPLTID